jgi:hypothetical protein
MWNVSIKGRWKSEIQGQTDEALSVLSVDQKYMTCVNSKVFQRKYQIRRILFMKPQNRSDETKKHYWEWYNQNSMVPEGNNN